ncbi:MAG: DUF1819 domain-containing protein [Deltaproteobacteria bacterium HGW-Deltaproteobacteria-14]|jgi:hypothetical protein|nr:MAG: DUF1819 domain-containing protein [Deltaproteobacteria bacterium HGW-Deltaproteobacteria-14]
MTAPRPAEATQLHTRLLKCALAVDASRAYWRETATTPATASAAFEGYWFGDKSRAYVEVLLANLRARFDAFPHALTTLQRWPAMPPDVRRLVCHWHLQLSDPLYRAFTGAFLPNRRRAGRPDVHRDVVIPWVAAQGKGTWTTATRIQFASKLLSAATAGGLIAGPGSRSARPLTVPRVPDDALTYAVHLLQGVTFAGSLVDNPYLGSLDLAGPALDARLRALPTIDFHRLGPLVEVTWSPAAAPPWLRPAPEARP